MAVADKVHGGRKIIKLGREIGSPRKGSCYFNRLVRVALIRDLGCDLKELLFQLGTVSTRVLDWAELSVQGNSRPANVTGAMRKVRIVISGNWMLTTLFPSFLVTFPSICLLH